MRSSAGGGAERTPSGAPLRPSSKTLEMRTTSREVASVSVRNDRAAPPCRAGVARLAIANPRASFRTANRLNQLSSCQALKSSRESGRRRLRTQLTPRVRSRVPSGKAKGGASRCCPYRNGRSSSVCSVANHRRRLPTRMLIRVVLPEPDRPTMLRNSPLSIRNEMFVNAVTLFLPAW